MSTELLTIALTAGVQYTCPQGRFFYIKSAGGPLSIRAEKLGDGRNNRRFSNMAAGFKFRALEGEGWDYLRIDSATSQTVEIIVGDDDVDVSNAVSVTGSVATSEAPASAVTASGADVSVANASASTIAANLSRKRLTIGALSTNTGSLRLQSVGAGANRGYELQAGMSVELANTAAVDVRNDSGAAQIYWIFEES